MSACWCTTSGYQDSNDHDTQSSCNSWCDSWCEESDTCSWGGASSATTEGALGDSAAIYGGSAAAAAVVVLLIVLLLCRKGGKVSPAAHLDAGKKPKDPVAAEIWELRVRVQELAKMLMDLCAMPDIVRPTHNKLMSLHGSVSDIHSVAKIFAKFNTGVKKVADGLKIGLDAVAPAIDAVKQTIGHPAITTTKKAAEGLASLHSSLGSLQKAAEKKDTVRTAVKASGILADVDQVISTGIDFVKPVHEGLGEAKALVQPVNDALDYALAPLNEFAPMFASLNQTYEEAKDGMITGPIIAAAETAAAAFQTLVKEFLDAVGLTKVIDSIVATVMKPLNAAVDEVKKTITGVGDPFNKLKNWDMQDKADGLSDKAKDLAKKK